MRGKPVARTRHVRISIRAVATFRFVCETWFRGLSFPCAFALMLLGLTFVACPDACPGEPPKRAARSAGGLFETASAKQRREVIDAMPLERLTKTAQKRILDIAKSPTIFRRLPTQAIACDRDMFLFLSRNPEVLVGMWDIMGVTSVTIERIDRYRLQAEDGTGTQCQVDLVYGDPNLHIYVATGSYDGKLATKPIVGSGVFVLRSDYAENSTGGTTVTGTLDCFVKFNSFGMDLVARTLSGLIGRSADNNFVETARFMSSVSQASEDNPAGMIDLSRRLPQVEPPVKRQFGGTILAVAQRAAESRPSRSKASRAETATKVPMHEPTREAKR